MTGQARRLPALGDALGMLALMVKLFVVVAGFEGDAHRAVAIAMAEQHAQDVISYHADMVAAAWRLVPGAPVRCPVCRESLP